MAEDEVVRQYDGLNGHVERILKVRTGKPGLLQFVGLQVVRHNLVTEQ